MILLTCDNCDKSLRLRDELAGKRIKCPDCGESIEVPRAGGKPSVLKGPPPKAVPLKKRAPVVEDQDDDEEDDVQQRKKGKKREADGKPSAIYFILGLILAVGGLMATAACVYISVTTNRDVVGDKEHDLKNKLDNIRDAGDLRSPEQKETDKADVDRLERDLADAHSKASRYTVLSIVSGVIFVIGVGLRGYHHIAMKSWMAEYHDVGKKKRRTRRDEDDEEEE